MLKTQLITVTEFEAFLGHPANTDRRFELIHGEMIEMSPTEEHGAIVSRLHGELYIFLKAHPGLGRLTVETRYQMPDDAHNARIPDLAFTTAQRQTDLIREGAVPYMPDLAVEVASPRQSETSLREKATYYLSNGGLWVWLLFPDRREIELWTRGQPAQILTTDDTISGGDLLPGFSLPVREIFAFD